MRRSFEPARGFLHLPTRDHLQHFLLLGCGFGLEFLIVFVGADYLTARHAWRVELYAEAELAIPLVPAMVVPYCSVYLGVALAPFVLRTRTAIDALCAAVAWVIVIAGVAFLLVPAELGFPSVADRLPSAASGWDRLWYELLVIADIVNLDYNLVPSLHVALFTTCIGAYFPRAGMCTRVALAAWIVIVAASTVLTHQHHLVDVAAGGALGAWGARRALRGRSHLLRSSDRSAER